MFAALIPFKKCNNCIGDDRKDDDSIDPNFEFSIFYDEEREHMMQTAANHTDDSDKQHSTSSPLKRYMTEKDRKKDGKFFTPLHDHLRNVEISKILIDKTVPRVVINPNLYFKQPKFKGNGNIRHSSVSKERKEFDPKKNSSFVVVEESQKPTKIRSVSTKNQFVL